MNVSPYLGVPPAMTCEKCPAKDSRDESSPNLIREVDIYLAMRIRDGQVIGGYRYRRELQKELMNEFDITDDATANFIDCAKKRSSGSCSYGPEEVKVNNNYL